MHSAAAHTQLCHHKLGFRPKRTETLQPIPHIHLHTQEGWQQARQLRPQQKSTTTQPDMLTVHAQTAACACKTRQRFKLVGGSQQEISACPLTLLLVGPNCCCCRPTQRAQACSRQTRQSFLQTFLRLSLLRFLYVQMVCR